MSRLYPNEQTIKPLVEPPPYSAETTQTQQHLQELPVLKELTFHRLPKSLLCFAIDQGKKNQLVHTTQEALKINFGIDDFYLNEVLAKRRTLPDNGNILQEDTEIGHYVIHTAQWTRGRFRVQPRTIILVIAHAVSGPCQEATYVTQTIVTKCRHWTCILSMTRRPTTTRTSICMMDHRRF